MKSIGVIDYGMGNLHSLGKALERVAPGQRVVVSYDAEELLDSIGRPRAAARPLVESYLRGWPTDILIGTK